MGNSVYFCTRKTEKCPHCGLEIKTTEENQVTWFNKFNDLTTYIYEKYYPNAKDDDYLEITKKIINDVINKIENNKIENKYGCALKRLNIVRNVILSGEKIYLYIV